MLYLDPESFKKRSPASVNVLHANEARGVCDKAVRKRLVDHFESSRKRYIAVYFTYFIVM